MKQSKTKKPRKKKEKLKLSDGNPRGICGFKVSGERRKAVYIKF